jgi:hypothetical protein
MKREAFNWDSFLWSLTSVFARQNKILVQGGGGNQVEALALIPFFDLINHEVCGERERREDEGRGEGREGREEGGGEAKTLRINFLCNLFLSVLICRDLENFVPNMISTRNACECTLRKTSNPEIRCVKFEVAFF